MGLYRKYALPRLIELAMKSPEMSRLRAALIPRANGDVLEVGVGSGLNLPFYSADVRRIYGVDPSAELVRLASTRKAAVSVEVDLLLRRELDDAQRGTRVSCQLMPRDEVRVVLDGADHDLVAARDVGATP